MDNPPHNGIELQEKLDVILTTAAFDQKVALLFLDDGVFQLKKGQQAEKTGLKDTLSIFNALELYEVNDLFIEKESLQERGLDLADFSLPLEACCRKDVNVLMKGFDVII